MGIGEPERNSTDTYERNMGIVSGNINDSDNEIPVRQYNVAVLRNLLRLERSEGRLQVTNKRVVFRAAGRSIGGRTTLQQEFNIDEIAGLEAARGYRFSFLHLLFGLLVVSIFAVISVSVIRSAIPDQWTERENVEVQRWDAQLQANIIERERVERERWQFVPSAPEIVMFGASVERVGVFATFLGLIFGFGGLAPFFLVKRRFLLKLLPLGAAYGAFAVLALAGNPLFLFLQFLVVLVVIVGVFLYCMRPDLAIIIKNKGAMEQSPPISIRRRKGGIFQFFSSATENTITFSEVMPTSESEKAIREVGAIIRDIQTLGDMGVEKWKQ
jgi:hypothetical protein